MDTRPSQGSSSSSSCCDCCQCNSQACSAYLIGILASILIISGVFLAFHRWDYAWLIISLIGTILMLVGSVLYFCVSNNDRGTRRSSAAKHASSSGASHAPPSAPALDQSRSVSQLSLNMLPPYFPAFDTISMTSHIASSTTPSVHAAVSQILNINGQAFLMLPLATSDVSQDTHSVGTKTSNHENTQISINSQSVAGPKTPVETRTNTQCSNRDSICAVAPLFVTLPPTKKDIPLQHISPDVLLLTDAMLGRGSSENRDKSADASNSAPLQTAKQSSASVGIQVETLAVTVPVKDNVNDVPLTNCVPSVQESSITVDTPLCEDQLLLQMSPSEDAATIVNAAQQTSSSQSSLQLSDDSLMGGDTSEPTAQASRATSDASDNVCVSVTVDPEPPLSDSGICDPSTITDAAEITTDLDDNSETIDDSLTTALLVLEDGAHGDNAFPEVLNNPPSTQNEALPCASNAELSVCASNAVDSDEAAAFPSTSVAGTDCEPLLPVSGSRHSLCDTDDESYLEGSSSPPPSYEEVARESNHSNADYGSSYGTI